MARVLPSEVVERIQRVCPWVVSGQGSGGVASRPQSMIIAATIALAQQIPGSMLRFSSTEHSDFIWAVTSLEQLVKMLQSGEVSAGGGWPWPSLGSVDAMTALWRLLKKCPDESISEETPNLPFIQDQSLQVSIQLDISSAESAFDNGEWKAATVLAAAAVEAFAALE